MSITDLLLPEYDNEIAVTRRVLERVPDDRGEWKPHPKSFPMGHLAQLVARLPGWTAMTMRRTELDLAPTSGPRFPGYSFERTATLLAEFDANAAEGRAALAQARDEDFQVPWTLKRAGGRSSRRVGTRFYARWCSTTWCTTARSSACTSASSTWPCPRCT